MAESKKPKRSDGIYHAPDVQVEPFPTLANSTMGGITAPIHPPHIWNDETLMYVAVRVGETSKASKEDKPRSSKLKSKLESFKTAVSRSNGSTGPEDIRVIRMPRIAYTKYFARNENDEYVGTEPERTWNDEDLENFFGRYRDFRPTRWVRQSDDRGKGSSALVPGKEVFAAAEGADVMDGSRLLDEA